MTDREDNKEAVNFYFYQKHMTNKNVLYAYNGKPIRMVISTLIEEGMRRMRNTSPSQIRTESCSELLIFGWLYVTALKTSGYKLP